MGKKRILWLSVLSAILLALVIWIIWGNTTLELHTFTIKSQRLPEAFSGYRIAQVSDLHNCEMGEGNEKLLAMLEEVDPDMIALTGDLVDSRNTDFETALAFAEKAMKIAPCYYVTGNHESRIAAYPLLEEELKALGVIVLEEAALLERGGETIRLLGVDDPSFQEDYHPEMDKQIMESALQKYDDEQDTFMVLLSHRPELFSVYAEHKMDLVLSGHAHGGQIRLPFVGGVFVPNQGFFPEYDAGLFTSGNTHMIVSRGIGDSIIPIRLNNRPELVVVDLIRE